MPIIEDLKEYILTESAAMGFTESEYDITKKILVIIDLFDEQQKKKYLELKKDGKISFGKFAGFSVAEVAASDKGRAYLAWILTQTWFVEKNPHLVEEIKSLGIKKVQTKRVPLD